MILTNCAACAAPLAHDAPRCIRCQTRYCNKTCQHDHWRRGHKQMCKKIHRGGNAEQYHADKKYKEAVAVAVAKCADDTKGQTCYICTQALHWKTKEGLVRMCACRGTAGFAHVSCLAEQAKILTDEAEANNLDTDPRWDRWHTCSQCEQDYHGVVSCALGWACWKTYVGRPETDWARKRAMSLLGSGLCNSNKPEDALPVYEALLSMERRLGAPEGCILTTQGNLATLYNRIGREEEALSLRRDVYSGFLRLEGVESIHTLLEAKNCALSLVLFAGKGHRFSPTIDTAASFADRLTTRSLGACSKRAREAISILAPLIPVARRVLGDNNDLTMTMRTVYGRALCSTYGPDHGHILDDLREAVATFDDIAPTARRVLGGAHPYVNVIETFHRESRDKLRAREMSARGASSPARRRGAGVPSVPSPGSDDRGGGVPMTARDAVAIASQYAND